MAETFKVKRELFLAFRASQISQAKKNPEMIVVDPGDEILCDFCNDFVEDAELTIINTGQSEWLTCDVCLSTRRLA